jgi:hypothetical protein
LKPTDGTKAKALHVHKGQIDGRTCHAEAESLIKAEGGVPGWQEMRTTLADLLLNTGFPPEEAASYDRRRRDPYEHGGARALCG